MALKAGSIVLLIDLSYKIKVPVICMKLFLSPFESGGIKKFMQVTGAFFFYARAIDNTMFPALSAIASEQNAPTENTMKRVKQFLDYAASQEE